VRDKRLDPGNGAPTPSPRQRTPDLAGIVVAVLVTLASWTFLFTQVERTRFHGDESGWISAGVYSTELIMRGDFDRESWNCFDCAEWGSLNMQVGKLLVGLPHAMDRSARGRGFFRFYDFEASRAENVRENRIPPPDILRRARIASTVFGAVCCLLIFAIGYLSFNVFVGVLASVLLATHPLFVSSATRAMTDVHLSMFLLALCLAGVLLSRAGFRWAPWRYGAVLGVIAGLACSVKITGLVIGGGFVAATLVREHFRGVLSLRDASRALAAFGIAALAVVYSLNPSFWPSRHVFAVGGIAREVGDLSRATVSGELRSYLNANNHPQLSNLSVVRDFPQLFLTWERFMARQGQRLPESENWRGNRLSTLHTMLFNKHSGFPGDWVFLAIGGVWYGRRRFWQQTGTSRELWLLPCLFFLVNYVFILLFMSLNWDRYYIPTVIVGRVLVAGGIYIAAVELRRRWTERRTRPAVGRA